MAGVAAPFGMGRAQKKVSDAAIRAVSSSLSIVWRRTACGGTAVGGSVMRSRCWMYRGQFPYAGSTSTVSVHRSQRAVDPHSPPRCEIKGDHADRLTGGHVAQGISPLRTCGDAQNSMLAWRKPGRRVSGCSSSKINRCNADAPRPRARAARRCPTSPPRPTMVRRRGSL
jgi:hypothetical protein